MTKSTLPPRLELAVAFEAERRAWIVLPKRKSPRSAGALGAIAAASVLLLTSNLDPAQPCHSEANQRDRARLGNNWRRFTGTRGDEDLLKAVVLHEAKRAFTPSVHVRITA